MKTYPIIIPERIKKNTQSLKVHTLLCDKVWMVINEGGVKQVLIFKNNGELLISTDGDVANGYWQFIPANQAVVLSSTESTRMFHLVFEDDLIIALQQDGKQETLFITNEAQSPVKTIDELKEYLSTKEKEVMAKMDKERESIAQEEEKERKEQERKERMSKCTDEIRRQAYQDTRGEFVASKCLKIIGWIVATIFFLIAVLGCIVSLLDEFNWFVLVAFLVVIGGAAGCFIWIKEATDNFYDYFLDRQAILLFLRKTDKERYESANKNKWLPVLVRVFSWLFAFGGTVIALIHSFQYELWDTDWGGFGVCAGLFLGFATWVWLGKIIARPIEKKMFGLNIQLWMFSF